MKPLAALFGLGDAEAGAAVAKLLPGMLDGNGDGVVTDDLFGMAGKFLR